MSRRAQPETGPQSHSGVTSRAQTAGTVTGKPRQCIHGYFVIEPGKCPLCFPTSRSETTPAGRRYDRWTIEDDYSLGELYKRGTSQRDMAAALDRTEGQIRTRLTRLREQHRLPPRILEEER